MECGEPIHFEYVSTNTPTGAVLTLYRAGTTDTVALSGDTRNGLAISTLIAVSETSGTVTVYGGTGTSVPAGNTVAVGGFAANGGLAVSFETPRMLPPGVALRVTGPGVCRVAGTGYLWRNV